MFFFEKNVFSFVSCFNAEELYQNTEVSLANDIIWYQLHLLLMCFEHIKKADSDTALVSYQILLHWSDP